MEFVLCDRDLGSSLDQLLWLQEHVNLGDVMLLFVALRLNWTIWNHVVFCGGNVFIWSQIGLANR